MGRSGFTTFGFILFSLVTPIVGGALGAFLAFLKDRQRDRKQVIFVGVESAGVTLAAVLLVAMVAYFIFFIPTIYHIHQAQMQQIGTLSAENKEFRQEVEWRKHNISTQDAVFPNLIYMLRSFEFMRVSFKGEPCVVFISATKKSQALASVFAQFGNTESECATFGPVISDSEPEPDEELLSGAVPSAIVVHYNENDQVAVASFMRDLQNEIQLKASHRMLKYPEKRYALTPSERWQHVHSIWLQFGNDVKWNSELWLK